MTVETDHLPLVNIMNKPLHQVPQRLQKMRMHGASALPVQDCWQVRETDSYSGCLESRLPTETKLLKEVTHDVFAVEMRGLTAFSVKRQEELRKKTKDDPVLQEVINAIQSGWPSEQGKASPAVKMYWDAREDLAELEGIMSKGDRIVIPQAMQKDIC